MRTLTTFAVLVALALLGCGGPSDEEVAAEKEAQEAAAAAEKLEAEVEVCNDELGEWVAQLQELDSRLYVVITKQQYQRAVGDIVVEYDAFDVEALSVECNDEVGLPAQAATNQYIKAADLWDSCYVALIDCETTLQGYWAKAESKVAQAVAALEDLDGEVEEAQAEAEDLSVS